MATENDMNEKQSNRIEIHGEELGSPAEELVEQRAREIAKTKMKT